jgi:signal peptide peptidase SppA
MKQLPRIISKVCDEPWFLTPEKHFAIQRLIDARVSEKSLDIGDLGDEEKESEPDRNGSQLIIPISGVIGKRLDWMESQCGGYDLDTLQQALDGAEEDDSIKEILLHIDSPGGTVIGVPEMASRIAACEKKVVAYTDTHMTSAAYYLAAGADEIYCAPSSRVGSIGVYCVQMDYSRQLANQGVQINAISGGRDKLLGAYWKPLSDADRAKLQAHIDKLYSAFKGHVMTQRPDVQDETCQGAVFTGDDCCANGLVDGCLDSIQDLIH